MPSVPITASPRYSATFRPIFSSISVRPALDSWAANSVAFSPFFQFQQYVWRFGSLCLDSFNPVEFSQWWNEDQTTGSTLVEDFFHDMDLPKQLRQ